MKPGAVVLAAGYSSRLPFFKPLLRLRGATLLEHAVGALKGAGLDEIIVVTGHRAAEVASVALRLGIRAVFNERYAAGMFSSVCAGIRSLEPGNGCFFLLPVDVFLIRSATLRTLIRATARQPGQVLKPCFEGISGHPPLIPLALREPILDWKGEGGLEGCFEALDPMVSTVEVPDANVIFDLDTPGDLKTAAKRLRRRGVPTLRECGVLFERILDVPVAIRAHGAAVAQVALTLGRALRRAGVKLDLELIEASARLHDMSKGHPHHDLVGAAVLAEYGFGPVAAIVAAHMDIVLQADAPVDEREVVYLADKMVQGVAIRPDFTERFERRCAAFAQAPEIQACVRRRRENAVRIRARMTAALGKAPDELLRAE